MEPDTLFIAGEAAAVMERTAEEVARLGQVVTPERPANGKGYRAGYSFRNLVEMRLAEEFARYSIPQKRIQRYLRELGEAHGRWLLEDGQDGFIVLDAVHRWGAGTTLEGALAVLRHTMAVVSLVAVDVGAIKRALRRSLAGRA